MSDDTSKPENAGDAENAGPPSLSHAGAVLDQAIKYMTEQGIEPQVISSALLGATLSVLVSGLSDEAVARILERAIRDVRAGVLRRYNDEQRKRTGKA